MFKISSNDWIFLLLYGTTICGTIYLTARILQYLESGGWTTIMKGLGL